MDATTTKADENELQKAINNITSASETGTEIDAVSAIADKVAAGSAEPEIVSAAEPAAESATESAAEPVVEPANESVTSTVSAGPKADYGDPDLGVVKTKALTDLRPLVEKVDLSPEAKFKIYREIITATHDKAAIGPAYEAATAIAVEKDRAEALLFVVEMIDGLGIGAG